MEKFKENMLDENSDVIHLWQPLKFKINKNYKFINQNPLFIFFSDLLYYVIAIPIITIITKLVYDLKIEGRENLKNIKNGAVSVSNHVLILDCAMIGVTYRFKKVYYTAAEGSFKIPFIRKLIRFLRAIPIPTKMENKKEFVKQINKGLQNSKIIHFYPEASLWPYCEKLRNFKNGAFSFAVENNVPVVPIVFTFRNPKGIRKIFKRKKDVTLTILPQIKYEENNKISEKNKTIKLKEEVYFEMKKIIDIKEKDCKKYKNDI